MSAPLRSSFGGLLLARLPFAHPGARRSHSVLGLAALLILLAAPDALAQRGATSGTRAADTTRTVRLRPDRAVRADPARTDTPALPGREDRARRDAGRNSDRSGSDRSNAARGATSGTRSDGGAARERDPSVTARPEARYDPNRGSSTRGRTESYGDRSRDDRYDDRRRDDRGAGWYDRDRYGAGGYDRWRSRIDFAWPWEQRFARGWSPRYRYRQVVRLESEGGYGRRWASRLELRTTYRQRVLSASGSRALVELKLEGLELFQDGRYLGRVERFPSRFERLRATLYRNGRADFDRDLLVVGDARVGFELVATRRYDGYAYSRWQRGDDLDAAFLDFRRGRAERVRQSRLFDPYGRDGYAPVSILPEDADWLGDTGRRSLSASPYYASGDRREAYGYDDGYFYGRPDDGVYARDRVAPRGETDGRDDDDRGGYAAPRRSTDGAVPERAAPTLRRQSDETHTTGSGARIRVQREAEITRVE